ncbi:alpha/beta-hydrolase [Exidia glandulosa HHB12029]|uniref:Alpha/beta-hydrolase n=1 Tax=Exidia glandulosa HHB12029 TaxID=1314781 RepID=A0A165P2C0_EXIGL|nr:alpha/beta-hydrolase [Exidia glandulosa HHB12029]
MRLLYMVFALLFRCGLDAAFHARRESEVSPFDWYSIEPSENITWTSCFGDQQCARLELPLDHSRPAGPKTQIALQMIPATDKANYQGTILVNPGGPGIAGTLFISQYGPLFTQVIGPAFDILAFDPRGTGATTPLAQCFASPQESDAWALSEVAALRVGDDSIPLARARDQVVADLCAAKLGGNGQEDIGASAEEWGPGRFMDTASVATDMLKIVEKLGQEKLQYYGVSYGTLLGQYFAAKYPHKVGRMILDGVVDGVLWQRGEDFNPAEDADRVMDTFFANCVKAGPQKCGIWETTPPAVAKRVDRILAALRSEPIPLPNSRSGPDVFTEDKALSFVFQELFQPLDGFPLMARVFRAIEVRDADVLSQLPLFTSDAGVPPWLQRNVGLQAIACSDFPPLEDSLKDDVATVRNNTATSRWAGPVTFSRLRVSCGAWKIRAKARYTGPVAAKLDAPVLAISNRLDPVTPISFARTVVDRFQGMRLLIQDTVGHTASLSLSNCVALAIHMYMANGTLPAVDTVCPPDVIPLVDSGSTTVSR